MPRSSDPRTRAYRQRLQGGIRIVDVAVDAAAVSALEQAGLLASAPDGHELAAVGSAIEKLLGALPRLTAATARPQAAAPPAPAAPVQAPPPQLFASSVVVVPGGGGQRRRR